MDCGKLLNQIERNLPAGGYSGRTGNARSKKQGINAGIALNGECQGVYWINQFSGLPNSPTSLIARERRHACAKRVGGSRQ